MYRFYGVICVPVMPLVTKWDISSFGLFVAIRPSGRVMVEAVLLAVAQKKAAVDLIDLYSQRGKRAGADCMINSGIGKIT